jgi:hypothetical protein
MEPIIFVENTLAEQARHCVGDRWLTAFRDFFHHITKYRYSLVQLPATWKVPRMAGTYFLSRARVSVNRAPSHTFKIRSGRRDAEGSLGPGWSVRLY